MLSYHCSLLMVDEPTASDATGSGGSPPASAAAWRPPKGGTATQQRGARGRKPHQKQQQQQGEWTFQRPRSTQQPARSSIEIAAAGAAVVAASQDAHKLAAEAAAVTLSWVDEADTRNTSGSRTDSQHSSAYSITSLLGSDAIADAAAELSKRFQEDEAQQQQQQQDGRDAPAGEQTGLSEQLLQQADQALLGPPASGNKVDAWVSAVAAASLSRRGSATLPARLSEDGGSTSTSISGSVPPAGSGLPGHSLQQQRRSLEGAASLDFMEELDDSAFINYMRVLSQSNSRPAASRPAADAAALSQPLASRASQPAAAAEGGKGGRLPHNKSAASGLSALSVDGSSTAPTDWARAVPAASLGQQLAGFPQQQQAACCDAAAQQPSTTASGPPSASRALAAGSAAGSVLSSHASVLEPPRWHSQLLQQQPSRFGRLPAAAEQPQPDGGGISRRPHIGSFLALSSWGSLAALRSFTTHSRPSAAAAGQSNSQQQLPATKSAGSLLAADTDAGLSGDAPSPPLPPLLPPPTTSAQLQPAVARAKAALAAARLEPWWLRPRALQHFDGDACMRLLDDIELLLVR